MNTIIREKVTKKQLLELGKHFDGYIKVVIDVKKGILAGGADRF
ncbi:MAG: hypothetical protein BWY24_00772 [Microgenomates group bacterium ADurb.Bin219]|nr:MAG: hypothetical protein BWY24_00772 [Microgenomates group bacterium ADurb.Bin219]